MALQRRDKNIVESHAPSHWLLALAGMNTVRVQYRVTTNSQTDPVADPRIF